MDKWKLCRQQFGTEEYKLPEGKEVSLGRGVDNVIVLSSLVVSRNHCVIKVKDSEVTIIDLKSSNGVYIGLKRIAPNVPHSISDNDIIGIGWTDGAQLAAIRDSEKYVFKLLKIDNIVPIINRLQYQSEDETSNRKLSLKRKLHPIIDIVKKEETNDEDQKILAKDDVVCILSDSDTDRNRGNTSEIKKLKLDFENEELLPNDIKLENDDLQYEAFAIKQEYLGDNDEPIQVDSESDSESEHWYLRLSQSSPGKPFMKVQREPLKERCSEENSYSQWDDAEPLDDDSDIYFQDLINIPLVPPSNEGNIYESTEQLHPQKTDLTENIPSTVQNLEKIKSTKTHDTATVFKSSDVSKDIIPASEDRVDNSDSNISKSVSLGESSADVVVTKKIQMIEPLCQPSKKPSHNSHTETKKNSKRGKKHRKHSSELSKKYITMSQKEERKKKLREIATKDKELEPVNSSSSSNKCVVNMKISNTNRGEFLTNVVQATIKPIRRKSSNKKSKEQNKSSTKDSDKSNKITADDKKVTKETVIEEPKLPKTSNDKKKQSSKSKTEAHKTEQSGPIKTIKPLMSTDFGFFGKPVSKVEPLPPKKTKKSVRFSNAAPEVHIFEIEPGNKMKETRLVKTSLVDSHQRPMFSLEKITLMKILRWNPHWLDEQVTNTEPPPILGHNNIPMAKFQSYNNHKQYIQLVGDLLLMEIWECITQAHLRTRNQNKLLHMRIENLPPVPPLERYFELFNLSVNISMPTSEAKSAPRKGEILMVHFGPEHARNCRFFFVHNVRTLPAPPNNRNTFFSIALYTTFTEKMRYLKPGELMIGRTLAYINKEIMLFEAMECLSGSPLSEAILKPEPWHFHRDENGPVVNMDLPISTDEHEIHLMVGDTSATEHQSMMCCRPTFLLRAFGNPYTETETRNMHFTWTKTLNESQKEAVISSVSAALGDRPSIQMVQGPPGTGKSSVICAMVMAYFYDASGRKQQNRGKILICATSNAAIDELVIRLLTIRQSLPKPERFKMVRVGRVEAMHSHARNVSSQQLAQRDSARAHGEPQLAVVAEQISHIEAKINMWRTAIQDAKDPVRVAYCQGRITQLSERISMLRNGGGGGGEEVRPDRLMATEKRIIDCADIIATTLASTQNIKMKGVKGRIALCIVDEAGQAIEPETLVPLTLDVTRLTLVGDPQQLPGFICSQRAKKHGLGESLFARLTSSAELWPRSPVRLLDQQYRMHPHIADYPNRAFYGGRVRSVPRPPARLPLAPYTIVGIASGDKGQGSSGANEIEACAVSRLAAALHSVTRPRGLDLAVITPYAAHRDLIKKYLRHDASESGVEVNTVDSFQGQERDVVVVSLARSQGLGFLSDAGRMNVMLTRARHVLVVCLNPLAVTKHDQWRTLIEDAQLRKVYTNLPKKLCRAPSGRTDCDDEILRYIRLR